jgi:hypothetical protein
VTGAGCRVAVSIVGSVLLEAASGLRSQLGVASLLEREGVAPEDVLDHVQAVFKTIREIVPENSWSHVLGQLPRDWPGALAPVPAPKHH